MRQITSFLSILISIGVSGASLASQPPETLPGFKPNNVLELRGIDNVNPFSGDPGIVLPLGPEYPLSAGNIWQLKAYYSAKFWRFDQDCPPDGADTSVRHALISGHPTLGAGWTLELGYVGPVVPPSLPDYHSPDGGVHSFNSTSSQTVDGSHLRIATISAGYRIDFPDGTSQTFDHAFTPPTPVPGSAFSKDFADTDWEFIGSPTDTRYGLGSITDSFGSTILRVDYVAASPSRDAWRVSQIDLKPNSGQARSIPFTWTTKQIAGGVIWNVLNSISFPTANGSLVASFGFDVSASSTFNRNIYDNSSGLSGPFASCQNPGAVSVPLLDTLTLSAPTAPAITYQFRYLLAPDLGPFFGALKHIVLPTTGIIDYTYLATISDVCFSTGSNCPDPETDPVSHPSQPSRPLSPNAQNYTMFWDDSAAVVSRTETDPVTGLSSAVTYSRYQFIPLAGDPQNLVPDETEMTRRTIVTAPTGNGSGQIATRYLFHVEVSPAFQGSGIELERRFYGDSDPTGVPVRTLVNCHEGSTLGQPPPNDSPVIACGFRDGSGNLQRYNFVANVRRQNEVTWFGVNPTGGGSCPVAGASLCTQSFSTVYNPTAGKYETTTVSSNLPTMPGWLSRASTIHWTPLTSPYLLNLYDQKTDSELSTVYQYFDFTQSNGFLRGSVNWDQFRHRYLVSCRYPDQADASVALNDFVATIDFVNNAPPAGFCSSGVFGSMPTNVIGINDDAFGRQHAYQDGLVKKSFWVYSSGGQNVTIGWNSLDVDREAATGLITTSRDPNPSLHTGYTYDALGRITSISPPTETPTVVTYDSTTQTTVIRTGGDGNSTWQRFIYDGFGRLLREIRQVGPGYAVRVHAYDTAGHAFFVSEWTACSGQSTCATASASSGTTSSSYDPLGRPQTITRADTSVTTISYSDSDPGVTPAITVSDSRKSVTVCVGALNCSPGATTVYRYDPLGRLIKVTEPGGDYASYLYDVNGKLTQVTQTQLSPSATQTRTFAYDAFGFLRSETTPEKGTVTYGSDYPRSGYGALGNLRRTTEGGTANVNLTFFHDPAGRVTCETDGDVPDSTALTCASAAPYTTRYVSYFYDGAGFSGGSYPAGKLTQRIGYNPGKPSAVTEQFTYSDPTGRLSSKNIRVDGTPQQTISVTESWTYNSLGLIATHTHPYRVGTDTAVSSTYFYSSGLPTGLTAGGPSLVSNVTYSPAAVLKSWMAGSGSGITTTISQDGSGIPRPSRISSSSGGFDTGPYSYDGAGNIVFMGSDSFGYDNRSRLTSSNIQGTQPVSYTYDAFGNLNPSSVDPATNRLMAGHYDGRGNLISLGSQAFAYDAFSRQLAASGGPSPATGAPERYLYDGAGERIARVNGGGYFYTIAPCRLLDTRPNPIPGGGSRIVQATGVCGIPAGASGIAGNVAVISAGGFGNLTVSAAETDPPTSTLNFKPGDTRANNFQGALSPSGQLRIADGGAGTDAILDAYGYFISPPAAETWNLTFRDESNRLSSEYTVGTSVTRTKDYFYFGNLLVSTQDGSGAFSYYSSDHLGTPRLVSGALSECHKYQPFGQEIACSFGNQPLKFAAMERDVSSGLDYDHARYSSPIQGRFLGPDTFGGLAAETRSWNRYAYVLNNPLRNIDPTGLITVTVDCNADLNCAETSHQESVTVNSTPLRPDSLSSGTIAFLAGDFARQLGRAFTDNGIRKFYEERANAALQKGHYIAYTIDRVGADGFLFGGLGFALMAIGPGEESLGTSGELIAGEITGFTKHGIDQAILNDGVGVSTSAMRDAVRSPSNVTRGIDELGRPFVKFVGDRAVVILNAAGKVITTWATSRSGWRYIP